MVVGFGRVLPLLDLVEALEEGDRDEDDYRFLAVPNLNLRFQQYQYSSYVWT